MAAKLEKFSRRHWQTAAWRCVFLLLVLQTEGCYYMQAIRGHADLMSRRRPVAEVIIDSASSQELRMRLKSVNEARDFAVSELLLPDNRSYRSYSDLERDYVVWNVFAAPEFELEPKTWCYPVAGCVAYRGYFNADAAKKFSDRLIVDGYDTVVGGVSAYSTLGRFSDPILNTMMRWSDLELVSTMFHELAHQKLYIKGDTAFNESFATAVAEFGMQRWLSHKGESERLIARDDQSAVQQKMMVLVKSARKELTTLYAQDTKIELKRARKAEILNSLSNDAAQLISESETTLRNWLAAPLNNARLVSINLYEGRSNAFRAIMTSCDMDFACFYARANEIAELRDEARAAALSALSD
ncbi:MAG: aminopeptidase [Woeseiaceae bacterium]|nr:aminopeptidase [Woeseiaceae bacterium]